MPAVRLQLRLTAAPEPRYLRAGPGQGGEMAAERVLITGGAGFLGGTLARALLADGHDVHLLVRPGTDHRRLDGRCAAHEADLCDAAAVGRAVAACRPEVVYHL